MCYRVILESQSLCHKTRRFIESKRTYVFSCQRMYEIDSSDSAPERNTIYHSSSFVFYPNDGLCSIKAWGRVLCFSFMVFFVFLLCPILFFTYCHKGNISYPLTYHTVVDSQQRLLILGTPCAFQTNSTPNTMFQYTIYPTPPICTQYPETQIRKEDCSSFFPFSNAVQSPLEIYGFGPDITYKWMAFQFLYVLFMIFLPLMVILGYYEIVYDFKYFFVERCYRVEYFSDDNNEIHFVGDDL